MKKQIVVLVVVVFVFSLACQAIVPKRPPVREGTVLSNCADIVRAVAETQPRGIPKPLLETGIKTGGEFNVNDYFKVLTNLSMQEGYSLDYVYQVDGLGAYPILYALPDDQTPYASVDDIPENTTLGEYWDHLEIKEVEQGYFEAVVMRVMARQFYLDWHANYNDLQIVCDRATVDAIVKDINDGGFGKKFDAKQMSQIRALTNIEPVVRLTNDSVIVEVVAFTKWGGFYRQTYTISRSFPHTIEMKDENLVPYDCGIMF